MSIFKRKYTGFSNQQSGKKKKTLTTDYRLLTTDCRIPTTGFTLMELLVVIAIIGMLAGILLPTLNTARERAMRTVCIGNLKVIGEAFNMYNIDRGWMPPTDAIDGINNYATNIIKTDEDVIVGLGYFYNDPSLTTTIDDYIEDFAVYVCPSSDHVGDAQQLRNMWANTPTEGAISTYIYRAKSGYAGNKAEAEADDNQKGTLMLSDARPAIVMDYNYETPPSTKYYNHKGEYVNILFKNGYVKGTENPTASGDSLTLTDPSSAAEKWRVFRLADEQQ